jgi:hypothetical protein
MRFRKVTTVSEIVVDITFLRKGGARVVGQVDSDDAVSSLAETS